MLSGGLPIHNRGDFSSFAPGSAKPILKDFDKAILNAVTIPGVNSCYLLLYKTLNVVYSQAEARKEAMFALTKHAGFRAANPREEHFVPLYVAAGAAETGEVKVLNSLYGIPTVAFGL